MWQGSNNESSVPGIFVKDKTARDMVWRTRKNRELAMRDVSERPLSYSSNAGVQIIK